MDEKMIQEITQRGRDFLKSQDTMEMERNGLEGYQTDQERKRPQPPLVKAPMTDSPIDLPRDFENPFWAWRTTWCSCCSSGRAAGCTPRRT